MDLKNNFWKDYPELEKELVQVQQLMKSHVTIKNSDVKSYFADKVATPRRVSAWSMTSS